MSIMLLILMAVIFVAVSVAVQTALKLIAPDRARQRLDEMAGTGGYSPGTETSDWRDTAVQLAGPFARLALPKEGWEDSSMQRRFIHAGFRDKSALPLFYGAKTALALIPPFAVFLALQISGANLDGHVVMTILFCVAALGYYMPNFILDRLVVLRQRDIFENFPDAADLLMVCVESGLGLDAALNRVADEMRLKSVAMAEELQLVNLEMRAGCSRELALRNLAMRTGVEEVNTFSTMLVQADRFGTSLGESLRVFSDELRTRRRYRAEETAAKIPLKLLFPLVLFIFPSLLLVLLGPAFIQVSRVLLPTMGGQ